MAKMNDISIPMNGEYKMEIVDKRTKKKYTIKFSVVNNATKGCPIMISECDVKPYRKKEPKPLLDLHEKKERLFVGIEKLF